MSYSEIAADRSCESTKGEVREGVSAMTEQAAIAVPSLALRREIEAYEQMRSELEANHWQKWVVIKDGQLVDAYDDSAAAAIDGVRRFGREVFLIRQVGPPISESSLPLLATHGPRYAYG